MVHVPAKFRENKCAKTKRDGRTDTQTGGALQYLPSRAFGAAGDNKVCRKTKFFVTLSWIWHKVKVKMKGMLHIYNDCTIGWHQVCANMWNDLNWVAHIKYHPSNIKYAEKLFCDLFLNLKWCQGQNERYVAHLQWVCNWLAPSVCKYV